MKITKILSLSLLVVASSFYHINAMKPAEIGSAPAQLPQITEHTTPEHTTALRRRQKELCELIKKENPELKNGLIAFCGTFGDDYSPFTQDPTFQYMTNLKETSLVMLMDLEGKTTLYIPRCSNRAVWMTDNFPYIQAHPEEFGIDHVEYLGGYVGIGLDGTGFRESDYANLIDHLKKAQANGAKLFFSLQYRIDITIC